MNKYIGLGIFGLLVYGAVKIAKVKNVAEQISTKLSKPRVHKIDFSGLTFRTEVKINNPTSDSLTLTKPVITLTSEGKQLTQSKSEDKEITIKPLSVTTMDTIELKVGWTVLGTYISGIIKKIPDLIDAFAKQDLGALAKVLGIPMERSFSTYSNGIFYQSTPTKIL